MYARVIIEGTYKDGVLHYNNQNYDAKLTKHVESLVDSGKIDLSKINNLIVVPHTAPEDKEETIQINGNKEQLPYLRFSIIGIEKNQPDVEFDKVNILGRVIYENVQYEFILVKIKHNNYNYEIIKLNGLLEDTLDKGKGNAVDKLYKITASIEDKSLYIEDSKCILNNKINASKLVYISDYVNYKNKKVA